MSLNKRVDRLLTSKYLDALRIKYPKDTVQSADLSELILILEKIIRKLKSIQKKEKVIL